MTAIEERVSKRRKAPAPGPTARRIVVYVILLAGIVITILPLIWMVTTALKTNNEAVQVPIQWWPSIPQFSNFVDVFNAIPLWRMLFNTTFVSFTVTVLSLFINSLAAYAFARLQFKGREVLFYAYLATLMVPGQVTMIPLFMLMKWLGWLDSYNALIWPSIFTAFGVFMLRQFFMGIPKEIEEAATIDGCGPFRIYWRMILPLSTASLVTLGIFLFLQEWSSFLWPLIVTTSPEMQTVQVGLRSFLGEYGTDWPLLMAGASIAELPILILYIFCQRYVIEGIATTGVKG
jgi:multiple sugar transport system permease protein